MITLDEMLDYLTPAQRARVLNLVDHARTAAVEDRAAELCPNCEGPWTDCTVGNCTAMEQAASEYEAARRPDEENPS